MNKMVLVTAQLQYYRNIKFPSPKFQFLYFTLQPASYEGFSGSRYPVDFYRMVL
jgi:hypothetical protein